MIFKPNLLHVYLAGPDVFLPNVLEIGEQKKQLITRAGCIAHFPMDNVIDDFKFDQNTAYRIARKNEELMDKSQVILVNMTPWHASPSMDVGTAFEAGYMSAKATQHPQDILIIGYTEGSYEPDFATRVSQIVYQNDVIKNPDGQITGSDGTAIESFGGEENLMIDSAIAKTGGKKFRSFTEAVQNIIPLWQAKQHPIRHCDTSSCE